jgi:hypothetical protein
MSKSKPSTFDLLPLLRSPAAGSRLVWLSGRPLTLLLLVSYLFIAPLFAEEPFVYDTQDRRNPFIPLVDASGRLIKLDKEEKRGDLVIEGIIFDKSGRSFAIINGAVVGVGDGVSGGYQVLKIDPAKVILMKDGQAREIAIEKDKEER